MDVASLKLAVDKYREGLPEQGKPFFITKSGPPSMGLIDNIVALLEIQDARIRELEYKLREI